jgi:NAD(P)H dehydrogenase (quinone)
MAERVFDWSGLTVTHLRPTFFAEWFLYYAQSIKDGLVQMPFG